MRDPTQLDPTQLDPTQLTSDAVDDSTGPPGRTRALAALIFLQMLPVSLLCTAIRLAARARPLCELARRDRACAAEPAQVGAP